MTAAKLQARTVIRFINPLVIDSFFIAIALLKLPAIDRVCDRLMISQGCGYPVKAVLALLAKA